MLVVDAPNWAAAPPDNNPILKKPYANRKLVPKPVSPPQKGPPKVAQQGGADRILDAILTRSRQASFDPYAQYQYSNRHRDISAVDPSNVWKGPNPHHQRDRLNVPYRGRARGRGGGSVLGSVSSSSSSARSRSRSPQSRSENGEGVVVESAGIRTHDNWSDTFRPDNDGWYDPHGRFDAMHQITPKNAPFSREGDHVLSGSKAPPTVSPRPSPTADLSFVHPDRRKLMSATSKANPKDNHNPATQKLNKQTPKAPRPLPEKAKKGLKKEDKTTPSQNDNSWASMWAPQNREHSESESEGDPERDERPTPQSPQANESHKHDRTVPNSRSQTSAPVSGSNSVSIPASRNRYNNPSGTPLVSGPVVAGHNQAVEIQAHISPRNVRPQGPKRSDMQPQRYPHEFGWKDSWRDRSASSTSSPVNGGQEAGLAGGWNWAATWSELSGVNPINAGYLPQDQFGIRHSSNPVTRERVEMPPYKQGPVPGERNISGMFDWNRVEPTWGSPEFPAQTRLPQHQPQFTPSEPYESLTFSDEHAEFDEGMDAGYQTALVESMSYQSAKADQLPAPPSFGSEVSASHYLPLECRIPQSTSGNTPFPAEQPIHPSRSGTNGQPSFRAPMPRYSEFGDENPAALPPSASGESARRFGAISDDWGNQNARAANKAWGW